MSEDKIKRELFYFSNSDLMIRVDYNLTNNTCTYVSHRDVDYGLDEIVKKYIYSNVIPAQSIFQNAIMVEWEGVDRQLTHEYNKFHAQKNAGQLKQRQNEGYQNLANALKMNTDVFSKDTNDAVAALLNNPESEKNALFNTIGNLLRDRNENHADNPTHRLTELMMLVKRYNKLVDDSQQVDVNSLINNTKE